MNSPSLRCTYTVRSVSPHTHSLPEYAETCSPRTRQNVLTTEETARSVPLSGHEVLQALRMIGLSDSQLRRANQQLTEQQPQRQPPIPERPGAAPPPLPSSPNSAITHTHPTPALYDRYNESKDRTLRYQPQIPGDPPHRAPLQAEGLQNTSPPKLHTTTHISAPTETKPPNIRVKCTI